MNIIKDLEKYLHEDIVPRYSSFDMAHREDHALTVIGQVMKLLDTMPEEFIIGERLVRRQDIDRNILLTAAACHDLGLVNGRERHQIGRAHV